MIFLDTSALIDSLSGRRRSAAALRLAVERGERILLPTLVLYEWRRGRRLAAELADQEALFPSETSVPFGPEEADRAAQVYRELQGARGRELDIAIAACALCWDARLWTLNPDDFRDIPDLVVERPA